MGSFGRLSTQGVYEGRVHMMLNIQIPSQVSAEVFCETECTMPTKKILIAR